MKTQSAKAKGRRLQQWTRDTLLKLAPNLLPDDIKSTSMGASGEDVQLSPAARVIYPVSIECKARKSFKTLYDMYGQAQDNSKKSIEPVLVIKQDRAKPLAVVDAEFLFGAIKTDGLIS